MGAILGPIGAAVTPSWETLPMTGEGAATGTRYVQGADGARNRQSKAIRAGQTTLRTEQLGRVPVGLIHALPEGEASLVAACGATVRFRFDQYFFPGPVDWCDACADMVL